MTSEKILETAVGGLVAIKILETGSKLITKQPKKKKSKGFL
jgi:hypothetical protein